MIEGLNVANGQKTTILTFRALLWNATGRHGLSVPRGRITYLSGDGIIMAKTALDLTPEELCLYRPDDRFHNQQMEGRWEAAWETARMAARLLRQKFGADQVAVFGSLAHRDWFSRWSDIDLAAWGIPPEQFYRAVAAVTGISSEFLVNLVALEACETSVRRSIEREGIDL